MHAPPQNASSVDSETDGTLDGDEGSDTGTVSSHASIHGRSLRSFYTSYAPDGVLKAGARPLRCLFHALCPGPHGRPPSFQ